MKTATQSPPPTGFRLSVGQLMLYIAFAAMVSGAMRGGLEGLAIANLATLAIFVRVALLERSGVRCPACGRTTMGRVAIRPFGDRYYSCSTCGARRKRTFLGVWRAAKGPRDDAVFRRPRDEGRWATAPDSVDESGPQGHLLQGKRHREAHPDYEPLEDVPEGGLIVPGEAEATPPDLPSDPAATPGRLLRAKRAASRRFGRADPSSSRRGFPS